MLLERMGETVTFEPADGEPVEVPHVLVHEADQSDQTVMDVQTRFINQARYKGDSETLTVIWPKSAPHDVRDGHLVIRGERYRIYGGAFPVARSPNGYDARLTVTMSLYLFTAELIVPTYEVDDWGVAHATEERIEVPVNLLRLSQSAGDTPRVEDLDGIVLLEISPDHYRADATGFSFQDNDYDITSREVAGETFVVNGTRRR